MDRDRFWRHQLDVSARGSFSIWPYPKRELARLAPIYDFDYNHPLNGSHPFQGPLACQE